MVEHRFDPDYVVPTSEVLREWLDERHLSTRVAAAKCGLERREVARMVLDSLLQGAPINEFDADMLDWITDISAAFWMSFEHNYRVGLAAGKHVMGADDGG
jgi:plasmid maintenance system antidote protein VapI